MSGARLASIAFVALLAACGSNPPPPDWQGNAKSSADDAVAAHLRGEQRLEDAAFARAQAQIARTGRPDLMARLELMRCAARVASLEFGACEGFERLRQDAAPAERAYAAYLAGRPMPKADIDLLPAAQQPAAAALAGGAASVKQIQDIADPLSRLVAIGVLFEAGKADPAMVALAGDIASAQGWRRPLLAWLEVQALRAEKAGASEEAQRLRRRIELVSGKQP
jgi:hypothetical protein